MDPTIEKEIGRLRKAKVKELKVRYRELFGEESHSSNRAHLFRRIAWRLQARGAGKLSERAQHRVAELADDADLRSRAPKSFWRALDAGTTKGANRDARLPQAGSVLTRIYQQRTITVRVTESGFEYDGKTYLSLSAVAYFVTGTRWNGFLFFGIQRRVRG
jgi:Protein of unknown function (DUF2924)